MPIVSRPRRVMRLLSLPNLALLVFSAAPAHAVKKPAPPPEQLSAAAQAILRNADRA